MSQGSSSLQRRLSHRHIAMIAIGGSIGTGLFVASGNAIYAAGPGGALLAYLCIGALVYILMTCLGEMAAYLPVSGTFCKYSAQFISPAFGFAMGYNYWFNWAITVAAELSAASFLMKFWFPHAPFLLWSSIFFISILAFNVLEVRYYGESEYWLSLIKVIAVLIFIAMGIFLVSGLGGHDPAIGLKNWQIGDAPFHHGWQGLLAVFLVAGFSFQGTELFGVAAGEAHDPQKSIPRAMKSVFWRILVFYIISMLLITLIIPYTDSRLINADTAHVSLSPFTIVLMKSGLTYAASIMNAVMLLAVLSAANSDMYSATRILWHLADEGKAPRVLKYINRSGVPVYALIATAIIGSLVFLSGAIGSGQVFFWLVNISSLAGFVAWIGIAASHYRFRQHLVKTGVALSSLPYRAKFSAFGTLFALIVCVLIICGQAYVLITQGQSSWKNLAATYVGIPLFLSLWLGHWIWERRSLRSSAVLPENSELMLEKDAIKELTD